MSALEEKGLNPETEIKDTPVASIGEADVEAAVDKALTRFLGSADEFRARAVLQNSQKVTLRHLTDVSGEKVVGTEGLLNVKVDQSKGDWQDELVDEYQKAADRLHLVDMMLSPAWHASQGNKGARYDLATTKAGQRFRELSELVGKSFNTTTNADFIPTNWSNQLIELVQTERRLPNHLTPITLTDLAPMSWPIEGTAGSLPYVINEGPGDTGEKVPSTTSGTTKLTVDPDGIGLRIVLTEKASEASIVAAQDYIMGQLVRSVLWGEEELIVNGDTTATHQDSAVTAANDIRRLRVGLRKAAYSGSTTYDVQTGSNQWSPKTAIITRGKLTLAYRTQLEDLCWVFGGIAEDCVAGDSTNFANLQVAYAIGESRASLITGGYDARFLGSPKVLSAAMADTLDASGYNTGVGTLGGALVFSRPGWGLARGGGLRSEVIWDGETRQYKLVVVEYIDLVQFRSADKTAAYAFNIAALA